MLGLTARRRSMARRATFVAAIGLVALVLTACNTGQETTSEPDPVDETPETAPEPESPTETTEAPEPAPEPEPAPVDGDCSASGANITAPALTDVPDEVVAARDFLLDAALRCDEQLLFTAIEESSMFTYSFGDDGDAIGYWWQLEEDGEEPFLRLAQVLATTPAMSDDGSLVVWPQVSTGRDEHTTDEAWDELVWMPDDDIAASQTGVGYIDWRVGISTTGEWRFFVRGD